MVCVCVCVCLCLCVNVIYGNSLGSLPASFLVCVCVCVCVCMCLYVCVNVIYGNSLESLQASLCVCNSGSGSGYVLLSSALLRLCALVHFGQNVPECFVGLTFER